MVLSTYRNPRAECARRIMCARDLLSLWDRSDKCSACKLAVNFGRICSLGNRRNTDGLGITSNDEIGAGSQSPLTVSSVPLNGHQGIGPSAHELLDAAHFTLDYGLLDICPSIQTRCVEASHDT
ncbi:hypothetical protein [Candidatus Anaplasma sp. TIGMIC]|uniref:hypothetical protein n=1 Tax=Candidatus Anaplasma sp. TIGMIC TaxID=3020713 RepID=UPI002330D9F8|nr:hypothetical protein [Candidatus Anaplasma sp. TIGMIC]